MEFLNLNNDGIIKDTLSRGLFRELRQEAENVETEGTRHRTGLSYMNYTCPHYNVSEPLKRKLFDFIDGYIDKYNQKYSYTSELRVLSHSSPWVFDTPWYNLMNPQTYLPLHDHDGVLSYTVWLKLPTKSKITFVYQSITGSLYRHDYQLTPKDEGKFIIFPAKLNHMVDPYEGDPNEVRISLAGNIMLKGS